MFQDVLFLTELECFVIDFQVLLLLTKTIKKNLKLKKHISLSGTVDASSYALK